MQLIISSQERQLYLEKLENILASKKLFLEHDFCMPKLAQEAGIPLYIISYVINSELNLRFTEYINLMRIEYFTEKVNDPLWKDFTIKEMSEASGFKCRTTLYRAFAKHLAIKIITANYQIQTLLIEQITKLQNHTSLSGGFSKRIFNFLIANSYLYSLSIESVAGNFNISVRTLQRKLKEEGVSYLQIIEEVRKSLAIHYIKKSSSSVKEISAVLGYSEPSGFVRAFKKWTGKTPSEYRNNK